MLLPSTCALCGMAGESPCPACRAALQGPPSLPSPPGVDRCRAVLSYDEAGRGLLTRLKYRNARSVVAWLAAAMAVLVDAGSVDVVCWVPTTAERRRRRGFDQAEVL